MMGETGCGKTALIKMAYKLINKNQSNMKILNIHAGTDDNDIIQFIETIKREVKNEDSHLLNKKIFEYNDLPEHHRIEYERTTTKEQQFVSANTSANSTLYKTCVIVTLPDGDDWVNSEHLANLVKDLNRVNSDIILSAYCACYENGRREVVEEFPELEKGKEDARVHR